MNPWIDAIGELRRRRGRSLLSLLSVIIAVSAIVGVASVTATTRRAYREVFQALAGRADLEVVAHGGGRFEQKIADKIRTLPGVQTVVPVFRAASILYAGDHKAKLLAVGYQPDEPESLVGFNVKSGRLPTAASEIALETDLARGLGLAVGDSVKLLTSRGLRTYKLTGLLALDDAVRLHQGGMLLAPLESLQRAFRSPGKVDALHLYLDDQKHSDKMIEAVSAVLPAELQVRKPASRSGLAEETLLLTEVSLHMAGALSFTTAVCITLSVFLMNVGERRRELSILRAVGATRSQIVRMVCREAVVMGIAGTVLGIPLGIYGGQFLIRTVSRMLQVKLPETPDLGWALAIGGLLGPAICLLAAWTPARRASRVSPLEGMRPVVTMQPSRGHRRETIAGLLLGVLSIALAVGSARGDVPIWSAIFGLIISLVALVLLIPLVLGPAVRLLAWLLRQTKSVEGEISQRLVVRHAGRSALTIGVLFIAVAAGVGTSNAVFSINDDIRTWYERTITADYLLRTMMPDMSGQDAANMSESLKSEIEALGGVKKVDGARFLRVDASGREAILLTRDFHLYDRLPLNIIEGEPAEVLKQLDAGGAAVGSVLAERAGLKVGDTLRLIVGDKHHQVRVAGIATEYTFGGTVVYMDRSVAKRVFGIEGVDSFMIQAAEGQTAVLETKLRALAERKGLLLQTFGELLRLINATVAGVTGGLWMLLALGLFIGALGVVNTLTMNVLEQTRELGMLRAVGMRRGQVVRTVLGQATLIGLLGILSGGVAGTSLARMMNLCLGSLFGHQVPFALRPTYIAALLATALAVVMLSALFPARRAAALNPVFAMRQE